MKPHRTDGLSLGFGLLFLLIVFWWAISRVVTLHLPAVGWMVAGALIVFGVIGLLGAIRSSRAGNPPVPVSAAPAEPEIPGDLPPEVHASIVQELLEQPTERIHQEHPEVVAEPPLPVRETPLDQTAPAHETPADQTAPAHETPADQGAPGRSGTE